MIFLLSTFSSSTSYFSWRGRRFGRARFRLLVRDLATCTPARLRTGPFNTVTRRRIGDCMTKSSFDTSSSRDGQLGDRLDLGGRDGLAVDHGRLEHQVRVRLGEVRQDLGERHRVRPVVGDRRRAREVLGDGLEGRPLGRPQRERVLHDEVLRLRSAHLAAQLGDLGDLQAREREQDRVRRLRQVPGQGLDGIRFFRCGSCCPRLP